MIPPTQRNSVLIVEDEPITRERLVEAISAHPLLQVIAATGSLRAGQEAFLAHPRASH